MSNAFCFHAGEYFVVGMDIEQYDASDPEKYLKGILHSEQEPWVGNAYQSYLAVLPSPLVGFDEFARKVRIKKSQKLPYQTARNKSHKISIEGNVNTKIVLLVRKTIFNDSFMVSCWRPAPNLHNYPKIKTEISIYR